MSLSEVICPSTVHKVLHFILFLFIYSFFAFKTNAAMDTLVYVLISF